jgi:hypothetical protein
MNPCGYAGEGIVVPVYAVRAPHHHHHPLPTKNKRKKNFKRKGK